MDAGRTVGEAGLIDAQPVGAVEAVVASSSMVNWIDCCSASVDLYWQRWLLVRRMEASR